TATISDVLPTATVTKSLDSIQCADVKYKVKVTNTDTAEDLTLSALSDSGFGDITTVHGGVLSTTCAVPQTIAVGTYYECAFLAHFCGTSHTNTVAATVSDNDGNTVTPPPSSDPLRVNVSAE